MRTDEEAMLAVAQGDLAAFEQIVMRYQHKAWSLAYRFLNNRAEAEDVAQDAFLKILAAAPSYRPSATFQTFLYRVLSRLCMDRARKMKPIYNEIPPDVPDAGPNAEEELLSVERIEAVRHALATLPPNYRMAIVLRYYDNLDYRGIAEVMETTEKAVERLLARGRAALAEELKNFLSE